MPRCVFKLAYQRMDVKLGYFLVVSQFASELLDAFEQKIQTETLPISFIAE
jgi:hypothetical protein